MRAGAAAAPDWNRVSSRIGPTPNDAKLAEIFGGHGETVENLTQIRVAAGRAIAVVRQGNAAILNGCIGDEVALLAKVFGG